jgi:CDGSH-type Zn-finger protein
MPKNLPFSVTLGAGTYHWCSCGKSEKEPFCDGAHKDTGKEPLEFTLAEKEQVVLCACQRTKTPPFCDGSHAR